MELNLNNYRDWLVFLKKTRLFFEKEGFLEVFTPTLVPSGAMEAQLDAFRVSKGAFLPTSPEFALKKLWLNGLSDSIFELSPSFRDNEMGESHLSEFTMLEFYRSGVEVLELERLVRGFFTYMAGRDLEWGEVFLDEFFKVVTGFELKPESDQDFLRSVCDFHGLSYQSDFSWNDLYQLVFINLIEPALPSSTPLFVKNYPPQIAALAKINSCGWADRIEIFWGGVELGNGYNELFEKKELSLRWGLENDQRLKEGKEINPLDQEFIDSHERASFDKGVGMAIGLERLFHVLKVSEENLKVWPFN